MNYKTTFFKVVFFMPFMYQYLPEKICGITPPSFVFFSDHGNTAPGLLPA
jgi:hypothetical protein